MKILFVCHRVPYPFHGGAKVRAFNVIAHLSRTHDVTVASMARSTRELEESRGLGDHCKELICERVSERSAAFQMAARAIAGEPVSMGFFFSRKLHSRVSEAISREKFDLIVVHCSSVAQYVEHVRDVPKILDFVDMDSQKWLMYGEAHRPPLSTAYRIEGKRLLREERRLAALFDVSTCTTAEELDSLQSLGTANRTDWFPNGVDHDYFTPSKEPYDNDLMSFIGRMDYFPNQEAMVRFCRTTLPLIQQRRPNARLEIVGADPSPEIKRLGQLNGVTVTGTVPDVRPFVTRSAVNVAPLRIARGTQNKILESMAMGVPVVVSEVAARGVDIESGNGLLCATSPENEAQLVVSLMEDPAKRAHLSRLARNAIVDRYDWRHSMARFDAIIEQCIADFGAKLISGRERHVIGGN